MSGERFYCTGRRNRKYSKREGALQIHSDYRAHVWPEWLTEKKNSMSGGDLEVWLGLWVFALRGGELLSTSDPHLEHPDDTKVTK